MAKKENEGFELMETEGTEPEQVSGDVVDQEQDEQYYVKFSKPYKFDDEYYEGISLSGLEDMTGRDMIQTQRQMERSGSVSTLPEMSLEYACIFASRATKMPVEFFQELPPRDAAKVKNRVINFIYGAD